MMNEHEKEKSEEKKKTLLIVDDEENNRLLLQDEFMYRGYGAVLAKNGLEGLEAYNRGKSDLIITDLIMPGMNGLEFTKKIRLVDSSIPIIFFTAYSSFGLEVFKVGANDYLVKSADLTELFHSVNKLLNCTPQDKETQRLRTLVQALSEQNENLEKTNEKLQKKGGKEIAAEAKNYKNICGSVAHSLKCEFLHMGNSIKEIRELNRASSETQEECDLMDRSLSYSQILLRRLLDYLDVGRPRLELIDARELLRKTELLVSPRLPSNIKLQFIIEPDMEGQRVSANLEQLMGVLVELIDNAAHVLAKNPKEKGVIEAKLEKINGEIGISIKDNGPGVPLSLRKKLLREPVPSKSGLGVGLYFCGKVVGVLGGTLSFRTSDNQGTIFTVLLQAAEEKEET
jgi:CheY-like chemotaxis protein